MPRPHAKLAILDWSKVEQIDSLTVPACAHHWVSDRSIRQAIDERNFDDPGIPWTEQTHRAARIATIALMMQAGVSFRPLHLFAGRKEIIIRDGNHRLRSYQFNQQLRHIPAYLYGNTSVFKSCLAEGEVWNKQSSLHSSSSFLESGQRRAPSMSAFLIPPTTSSLAI